MKAYYEYEDGTFWAILTAGGDCFTAERCKYEDYWTDRILKGATL